MIDIFSKFINFAGNLIKLVFVLWIFVLFIGLFRVLSSDEDRPYVAIKTSRSLPQSCYEPLMKNRYTDEILSEVKLILNLSKQNKPIHIKILDNGSVWLGDENLGKISPDELIDVAMLNSSASREIFRSWTTGNTREFPADIIISAERSQIPSILALMEVVENFEPCGEIFIQLDATDYILTQSQ